MSERKSSQPQGELAGIVPVIDIHRRLSIARDVYDPEISQEDFAALIGASKNTISNYETGAVTRLKDIYLQKWAEVTGISYWWIKTGLDPDAPEPQTKD
ncbi:helix-turn-helix domain-containing protein [Microbacterium sp. BR1]|uniref:helix-turn-helix domain-containing protein n=1 Tax=Microbacterium sp. BR1 TaxID=1070896 RepID=UPI000C2CDA39|nr:helix-turn-helix transcriptional regulator [Microbacterium sp. BR1]